MKKFFSLLCMSLLMASVSHARVVTGSVACGKDMLQNVIVTDGRSFTKTDAKGRFKFRISDKADFVYVVTPKGYTAPYAEGSPVFYKDASQKGKFAFELIQTSTSSDYSIIAIADSQTAHEKHFAKFQKKAVPDLVKIASEQKTEFDNTIGITLGDITWDRTDLYPGFKEEFARTQIPFYPVIGNHDHLKDSKGDYNTSSDYRKFFGPENYAFAIGDDYVIVLDNVVYDTQKKYKETYTKEQLAWVEKLLDLLPKSSHLWIAQHCTYHRWFSSKYPVIARGSELLDLLDGRQYDFLTGHTHINNVLPFENGGMEHNVAAICGSWWIADHCTDGTPAGFKVFEKKNGEITWAYRSLGQERDYQIEVFHLGESFLHPNAIVANVWDYDPEWKVEWYQDGKSMGPMTQALDYSPAYVRELNSVYMDKGKKTPAYKLPTPNPHYFIAEPSQYASQVQVKVTDRFGNKYTKTLSMNDYVDVQAHRGGAGLMPENTILAMENALKMGVNTLEFDLQISQDGKVVVSHDAYFHSRYSTRPDGSLVQKSDPKEYLYTMPYEQITKYDVGMRPGTNWPDKACVAAYKPLLSELLSFVENYVKENGLTSPRYNIEIKSKPGKAEGKDWPEYHEFVDKCVAKLKEFNLGERLVIQSFDVRALNYMHEKYPELILSYLVDKPDVDFDKYMSLLSFTPTWLSPHWSNTDKELVDRTHNAGMKIVPWTVDQPEDISRLIELGVDAIISNYPDRVLMQTRGFVTPLQIPVR